MFESLSELLIPVKPVTNLVWPIAMEKFIVGFFVLFFFKLKSKCSQPFPAKHRVETNLARTALKPALTSLFKMNFIF